MGAKPMRTTRSPHNPAGHRTLACPGYDLPAATLKARKSSQHLVSKHGHELRYTLLLSIDFNEYWSDLIIKPIDLVSEIGLTMD
jgi:hypothetical protein